MRKWLSRANTTGSIDALAKIATTSKSHVDNARKAGKEAEKTFLENARRAYLSDLCDASTTSSPALTQSSPNAGGYSTAATDITKKKRGGTVFKAGRSKRARIHTWYTRSAAIFLSE